ncbi:MAG: cyclase family protein [Proteobacteria bacterium]|nr:cyclase family protein [Pseudomonadota bacterium]
MPTRTILDLTKIIDPCLEIYRDGDYADPAVEIVTWCTVDNQGYWVSRLGMGTQTGTHIDAPAHFCSGGDTLDALPVQALIGRYHVADLHPIARDEDIAAIVGCFDQEPILFLRSHRDGSAVTERGLMALCELPARVWVVAGSIAVQRADPLYFHRFIARFGKYLIEDLDTEKAGEVEPGGELIGLPLRLSGVSGSPCRVVVVMNKQGSN